MTTFAEQINLLATRAGTECKTLHTKIGELTSLTTTDKTSVIKAVNEVKTATSTLQSSLNELTSRVGTVESSASTNTVLGDVNNETIGQANLKNRSERTESLKRV